MLKNGLAASERTGDKAGSPLRDRIQCVHTANAGLQYYKWPRFFPECPYRDFNRPLLHHVHLNIFTFTIGEDGNGFIDLVIAGCCNTFNCVLTFKNKRHHNLMRHPVLFHLPQPVACSNGIIRFSQRFESPNSIII